MRHANVAEQLEKPIRLAYNDVEDEPVLQPVPPILKPFLKKKYKSASTTAHAPISA